MWKSFPVLASIVLFLSWTLFVSSTEQSLAVSSGQVNTDAFAVDTVVYAGKEKLPIVRTRTVFRGRRAYDQIQGRKSIALFDFEGEVIWLIDSQRRIRTGLSFGEILQYQTKLRKRAEDETGPRSELGAFMANPKFIRELNAGSSTISLSNVWLTYTATGVQSSTDEVERFIEFADWSARLASILNRSAMNAQARLELNEELKTRNWRVTHVTRTGGPRARNLGSVRSEHKYRTAMSKKDQDLIVEAEKLLKETESVSFPAYHVAQNSGQVATKK